MWQRTDLVLGYAAILCLGAAEAFSPASLQLGLGGAKGSRLMAQSAPAPHMQRPGGRRGEGRGMIGRMSMLSPQDIDRLKKNKNLDGLFKGNKAWRKEMLSIDEDFFKESAKGQTPSYLWIGEACVCTEPRSTSALGVFVPRGQMISSLVFALSRQRLFYDDLLHMFLPSRCLGGGATIIAPACFLLGHSPLFCSAPVDAALVVMVPRQ